MRVPILRSLVSLMRGAPDERHATPETPSRNPRGTKGAHSASPDAERILEERRLRHARRRLPPD